MNAEQLLKEYADGRRDFSWVDLRGVNLVGACLSGINLYRADLTGAMLEAADLRGANLLKADLTNANLTSANLTQANLHRADLTGTVLTSANLNSVHFSDVVLPQGLPSIPSSLRQGTTGHQPQPASRKHLRTPTRQPVHYFHSRQSPTVAELPIPTLALLWAGYCCFGGILGIHNVPDFLWVMVWASALAWMLGESMAWFTPVLGAIAVMLGSGLSLWALILAASVAIGLGMGLLLLGWPLPKALKDSLWIGGIITILINLSLWLVQGDGNNGVVLSGYFPLAFLLLIGMGGTGMGAIAWLQMHTNGFRRRHIAWTFGGCAALGLLSGGLISSLIMPSI